MKTNILLLGLILFLSGCVDDFYSGKEIEPSDGPLVEVNLSITVDGFGITSKGTRADPAELIASDAEKKIENIWVFQYGENGAKLIEPVYYDLSSEQNLSKIKVLLKETTKSTICIVANTFDSDWAFEPGRNFSTIENYKTQDLSSPRPIQVKSDNSLTKSIPMEGNVEANVISDGTVNVTVYRMYAKLKISFGSLAEGMTRNSIVLKNIPIYCQVNRIDDGINEEDGFEFPDKVSFGESFIENVPQVEGEPVDKEFIIYVPENHQGVHGVVGELKANNAPQKALYIEMGIKSKDDQGGETTVTHKVYPGANSENDFNIIRNNIYKIIVNVSNNDTHTPSSNCFIVTPGTTLSFEPYYRVEEGGQYGEDADIFKYSTYLDPTGEDESKKISYVQILWQTEDAIGDNTEGTKVRFSPNANPLHSKIYVETNKEGNALIGAFNSNDEIIWSWHIWITANKPHEKPIVYYTYKWDSNGIKSNETREAGFGVMSCNLGALSNNPDNYSNWSQVAKTHGMLYQWGRKDPFPPMITENSATHKYDEVATGYHYDYTNSKRIYKTSDIFSTIPALSVDIYSSFPPSLFYSISGNELNNVIDQIGYSISHPLVYMCGTWDANKSEAYAASPANNYANGDWLKVHNNKLWGGLDPDINTIIYYTIPGSNSKAHIFDNYGDKKTIFDPCPAGWRVPPGDLWLGFTKNGLNPNTFNEINYYKDKSNNWGMTLYMEKFRFDNDGIELEDKGPYLYFPNQGPRMADGLAQRVGTCGNYHNATTDLDNRVNILHIHNTATTFKVFEYTYYQYYVKSVGGPIRCVREDKTI